MNVGAGGAASGRGANCRRFPIAAPPCRLVYRHWPIRRNGGGGGGGGGGGERREGRRNGNVGGGGGGG